MKRFSAATCLAATLAACQPMQSPPGIVSPQPLTPTNKASSTGVSPQYTCGYQVSYGTYTSEDDINYPSVSFAGFTLTGGPLWKQTKSPSTMIQQASSQEMVLVSSLDKDQYFWCITLNYLPAGDIADAKDIAEHMTDATNALANIFYAHQSNDPAKVQEASSNASTTVSDSKQAAKETPETAAAPTAVTLATAAAANIVPQAPAASTATKTASKEGIRKTTITNLAKDAVHDIATDVAAETAPGKATASKPATATPQ